MKLTDRVKYAIAKRWFGTPGDAPIGYDRLGIAPTTSGRALLGEYQGIVYACITAISEPIGSTDFDIAKVNVTGEPQNLPSHEFLSLLENPNPDMTKFELLEATQSFIELTGECFWYFALGEQTKRPKEVYIIRPDRMSVVVGTDGNVIGYKLKKEDHHDVPFDIEEIMHFKRFNPNNAYRGLGTVQAGMNYIDTERFATKFARNFLYNNATPSGILSLGRQSDTGVEGGVSKETYESFKRRWREGLSGTENAGKVAIVRNMETNFTKIGLSLADIDLKALRELSEDSILKMFRMPRAILGFADQAGLGRGNVETLEYIFNKRVLEPKLQRLDAYLQRVVDRFYTKEKLKVSHKNIVPSDKEFELKEREAGVDKWITRNDIRRENGDDPKPGGDDLYVPVNYIKTDGVIVDKSKQKFLIKLVSGKKKDDLACGHDHSTKAEDLPVAVKENFRVTLMQIQEQFERIFNKNVISILSDQQKSVLDKVHPKSLAKDFQDSTFNLDEEVKKFMDSLSPVVLQLIQEAGQEALQFAGVEDMEFLIDQAAKDAIIDRLKRSSTNFNDDTISKLSKTLAEGFANDESISKIKKRVVAVFAEAKGYRAERISRTETLFVANQGTEMAYFQSGYVTGKQWYANPGACEFCRQMDGKVMALGKAFGSEGTEVDGDKGGSYLLNYGDLNYPPLHPDCRCTIIPVRE